MTASGRRSLLLSIPVIGILVALAFAVSAANPATPMGKPSALQQARIDAAAKMYPEIHTQVGAGAAKLDDEYEWSVRWFVAQKEVGSQKLTLTAAQEHLDRMKALDASTKKMFAAGAVSLRDTFSTAYYVAEAEVWLAQAK